MVMFPKQPPLPPQLPPDFFSDYDVSLERHTDEKTTMQMNNSQSLATEVQKNIESEKTGEEQRKISQLLNLLRNPINKQVLTYIIEQERFYKEMDKISFRAMIKSRIRFFQRRIVKEYIIKYKFVFVSDLFFGELNVNKITKLCSSSCEELEKNDIIGTCVFPKDGVCNYMAKIEDPYRDVVKKALDIINTKHLYMCLDCNNTFARSLAIYCAHCGSNRIQDFK